MTRRATLGSTESSLTDPEALTDVSSFLASSITRPGKLNPDNPMTKKLWVESIVKASCLRILYNLYTTSFFILYNLTVNIFSTIGNLKVPITLLADSILTVCDLGDNLADILMISVLATGVIFTIINNTLSKFKEVGKAIDAIPSSAKENEFYYNLLHKLEEVLIFDKDKHVLCLPGEEHSLSNTKVEILKLLQEQYYESTQSELEIVFEKNIVRYCEDYHQNNKNNITIITSCDLNRAELPKGTRLFRFYADGWIKRLQDSFRHAPFTQGIPTLIKAILAFIRWNLTIGIQSALSMITGIHAAFGIVYSYSAKGSLSPLSRAAILASANFISLAKTLVNKDLKQHQTDHLVRLFCESLWHWQPFSIQWKEALMSLATGAISILFIIATSFFYAERGPITLCEEVAAITGLNIPLNHAFLFYFSMLAILTGIITTFATGIYPQYKGMCKTKSRGACENTHTQATLDKYPVVASMFRIATWGDSGFFGGNARFNVIKTLEILRETYPEFLPFLHNPIISQLVAASVGVSVALQACYWSYYTAMIKLTANMAVWEIVKALFLEKWGFRTIQNADLTQSLLTDDEKVEAKTNRNHTLPDIDEISNISDSHHLLFGSPESTHTQGLSRIAYYPSTS